MVGAQALRVPAPASIDTIFTRYDSATTPGCAVAVVVRDSVVFRKAYGMAHIGFKVPMTMATTTWIPYSEARIFTALAVAMLARDGTISLDDPIRHHFPELPAYAGAVTVRHLLHHRSGLVDYGVLDPGFDLSDRMAEDAVFRILAQWGKLEFAPGRGHVYSNTDYALLRMLVERVTRRSLHDVLHERVFKPLGMLHTRIGVDQGAVAPAHGLFHEVVPGGWRNLLRYRVSPVGGIAVTTNADDLTTWARALRNPATGFTALLASLEPGATDAARTDGFAYGIYPGQGRGRRQIEYRGVGNYIYLTRVPEDDLAVVTVCNAYGGMERFGPDVAELFAKPVDAAVRVPQQPVPTVAVPVDALRRYVGEYVLMDGRATGVHVTLPDSVLIITLPNQSGAPARATGEDRFEFVIPKVGTFDFTFAPSDSTPGGLLVTGTVVESGEVAGPALRRKVTRPPTPTTVLREYAGTYVGDSIEATLHVSIEGERVIIAARGLQRTELQPHLDADSFRFSYYVARFQRDAAGAVTHLTLDATRVKNMRYTRRAAR